MSRRRKLFDEICRNPKNVRFEDLDRVLQLYGFEVRQPSGGSSHYIYKRTGCAILTVPRHKPVKEVYVKRACSLIRECVENDDD